MQELDAALQAETFTILACRIGRAAYDGRLYSPFPADQAPMGGQSRKGRSKAWR